MGEVASAAAIRSFQETQPGLNSCLHAALYIYITQFYDKAEVLFRRTKTQHGQKCVDT